MSQIGTRAIIRRKNQGYAKGIMYALMEIGGVVILG